MSKFIRNLLMAYVLMLVLSLIAFLILYTISSLIIEDRIIDSRLASLRQIRTSLDYSLVDIIQSANHVASDPQIRRFMHIREPYSGPNVIRIIETMQAISELQRGNLVPIKTFVIYDYGNIVVSSNVAWATSIFYPYHMNIEGMDYQAWRELIFTANYLARFISAMNVSIGGSSFEVIQYIVPLRAPQGNRGAVVTLIDNRVIQDMFRDIYMENGEWGFILSSTGEVISFIAGEQDISGIPAPVGREGTIRFERNGANYLMSYTRSNFLDWTYVSILESDYVLAELNTFRRTVMLVVFIMLCITLPLSIVFSIRQSKPIKKLQETLATQMPLLQHSFIRDIFDGKLFESGETMDNMASLKLDLNGGLYVVMVISGKDSPMDLIQLTKVHMLVDSHTAINLDDSIKHYSLSLGKNVLAVLFIGEDDNLKKYVREFTSTVADALRGDNVYGVNIGVGGAHSHLTDVYKSYSEALEAIQYFRVINSAQVVCMFEDRPHNNDFYYYPEEEEQRLYNMVRSGEVEGVRESLNKICSENFMNKQLSHNMMTAFINHLCQGVFKVSRLSLASDDVTEKANEMYGKFYQFTDLEKLMWGTRFYTMICENIRDQKNKKTHKIFTEIKAMCEEGFHDPDISLTSLAEQYNLSETYLSVQFKEQIGENFYNYLQTMRINKAIELLANTKLTIHEISERVGYYSYNTFSKAFKRKTGVNAGDYRRNM